MNKYLISLLCICMALPLASCGGRENGKAFGSQDKIIESGQTNDTYLEDRQSLINRIESRNGLHTLEQAEKIGLGSREYELVI